MSATTNLGKVSVTPKGAWAITNAYEILDIVTSGGSSYLAKQNVPTGVPLSNTSYWIMIAEKGDGGEITSASASISGGYGTPGVSVTAGGTAHERTLAFAFENLVGNGVVSIEQTTTSSVSGGTNIITCTLTDGNSTTFAILNGTDGDAINIAPSYDSTATYNLGDLVVYNDTLYECTTAIPVAEAWDSTHWTATDVSGQLSRKANIDGSYDLMNTGTSDNWTPYSADSGATQDIPFIGEATGGGNGESVVDTGSYLQFKKKLGNTVGVNQGIPLSTTSVVVHDITFSSDGSGVWTANGTADADAYTVIKNNYTQADHYYLIMGYASDPNLQVWMYGNYPTTATSSARIFKANGTAAIGLVVLSGVTLSSAKITPKIIDLTLWFGSNDRIPSDLLSHPENWGRYYAGSLAYNAGTLESADGTVMRSIGRNIWNEQTRNGYYAPNGAFTSYAGNIANVNPIYVIPNATYHFESKGGNFGRIVWFDTAGNVVGNDLPASASTNLTARQGAAYFNFDMQGAYGSTYKNDITISLYYSGESGYDTYYPFSVLAEVDTGSEVLRSAGSVADEKTPDGTITRNVGEPVTLDLSTMTFTQEDGQTQWYSSTQPFASYKKPASNYDKANAQSGRFVCMAYTGLASNSGFGITATGRLGISNDIYTNRASYTSVVFFCEAATPTTEQGTAFPENIPCDDFGSLMWTQTKGVPQGNEIFYPVDYKASIDTLYNRVEGDMGAIVIDSQLGVVADRIPEAPSSDGTYTLKATVSSGTKTYSWVADE